jgi:hypothetical protein
MVMQAAADVILDGIPVYESEPWAFEECDPEESPACRLEPLSIVSTNPLLLKLFVLVAGDAIGCIAGALVHHHETGSSEGAGFPCVVTGVAASGALALGLIPH